MTPTASHTHSGNRRHHPRAALDRQVQFYCNSRLLTAQGADISEGGLRLEGSFPGLSVGDVVKLFVPVPQGRAKGRLCLLEGRVVWRQLGRVGVRFLDPPLESMLQVRDFVRLAA